MANIQPFGINRNSPFSWLNLRAEGKVVNMAADANKIIGLGCVGEREFPPDGFNFLKMHEMTLSVEREDRNGMGDLKE